jgi:hypothetical protein
MKLCYEKHSFRGDALVLVEKAEGIMADYRRDGYDLTLRQLYYQFVARDLLANNEKNYKRLGDIISQARLSGMLHWDIMVDRTREVRAVAHWDGPGDIVNACASQFRLNTRSDQDCYIEAWVEKEALAGIVVPACHNLDINSLVCRGYVSQSAMWEGAMRFGRNNKAGKECVLLYLGDHDPSGIDMTRDIRDRLNDTFGIPVEVVRIALTMDQIDEFQPPPNPAKITDSRYEGYLREYGVESWEMDALDPRTLETVIQRAVEERTDAERRDVLITEQLQHREQLSVIAAKLKKNPGWKPGK